MPRKKLPDFPASTHVRDLSPVAKKLLEDAGWEFTAIRKYSGASCTFTDRYGVMKRTIDNPMGTAATQVQGFPTLIASHDLPEVDNPYVDSYIWADEIDADPEDLYITKSTENSDYNIFVTPFKDDESGETYLVEVRYPNFPEEGRTIKTPLMRAIEHFEDNCSSDSVHFMYQVNPKIKRLPSSEDVVKNPPMGPLWGSDHKECSESLVEGGLTIPDTGNDLTNMPSIALMRANPARNFIFAVDCEYYYDGKDDRYILTYQCAFLSVDHPGKIEQVIFYSLKGDRLDLGVCLSWVIGEYNLLSHAEINVKHMPESGVARDWTKVWRVPVINKKGRRVVGKFKSQAEAISNTCDDGVREFLSGFDRDHQLKRDPITNEPREPGGFEFDWGSSNKFALPVTVLFHSARNDLSGFAHGSRYAADLMVRVSDVQGGLVSLRDMYLHPASCVNHTRFYPIRLSMRDTMCFAPEGKKHLEDLGEVVQVPKMDVVDTDFGRKLLARAVPARDASKYIMKHMDEFLVGDPVGFMEYSSRDAVVTLCYASALWGFNCEMPVTITSASARMAHGIIGGVVGDVDKNYRGLMKVSHGKTLAPDRAGYLENTSLEPLNENCDRIQRAAQQSYHGGFNASMKIGYFKGLTHDVDMKNAYPTCMSVVPDIDWDGLCSGRVIYREWNAGMQILKQDFHSPFDPIFGFFEFEFPDTVPYPCIPVNVDGSLVFPRTSKSLDGVYACGPEIFLALQMGATVRVAQHGSAVQAAYRTDENGNVSHSLFHVVRQLVRDRAYAKKRYGEGSLADLLLKVAVNAIYGKTAQDVVDKWTWDAFRDEMVNIGGSIITSPVHASLTTAGVRAVLCAAMNELSLSGHESYSVTTDGFITDAPIEELDKLKLFGFADIYRTVRHELTGDDSMWSEKHNQMEFLNFTTRGNVALNVDGVANTDADYDPDDLLDGVCAHNSFVTGLREDSYEDRVALARAVLTRKDRVTCENKQWSRFRELASREHRKDFNVEKKERSISMDFDMKRKPIRSSFETAYPVINGETFEIANFDTEPYADVEEYRRYRDAADRVRDNGYCLRTMEDWALFWHYIDNPGGRHVHTGDLDWRILISCVRGHHHHGWTIPFLEGRKHSVAEKIEFINSFNKSDGHVFTRETWRNTMRKDRKDDMLSLEMCEGMLQAMCDAGDSMPDE